MTHEEQYIIESFKSTLRSNLTMLRDYLDVIIPIDETDEKIFQVSRDMIDNLLEDIRNGNNNELSASVDLVKVVDSWVDIEPIVASYNSYATIQDVIDSIIKRYGDER